MAAVPVEVLAEEAAQVVASPEVEAHAAGDLVVDEGRKKQH